MTRAAEFCYIAELLGGLGPGWIKGILPGPQIIPTMADEGPDHAMRLTEEGCRQVAKLLEPRHGNFIGFRKILAG